MTRIFISYSRVDEKFARQLATALSNAGHTLWLDVVDIKPGEKWSTAIQKGLDESEVMIVILSPDSMSSSNVEDEWQYYFDKKKPVYPVLLRRQNKDGKDVNVHFQLSRIQYIDFEKLDFNEAFKALNNVIQNKAARQNVSNNFPYILTQEQKPKLQKRAYSAIALIIAILIGAVMLLAWLSSRNPPFEVTNTPILTLTTKTTDSPTNTPIQPTLTPTVMPTNTVVPTIPTNTSIPPTLSPTITLVPPTLTSTMTPTNTVIPTIPTDTPQPTFTSTTIPTETPQPTFTSTISPTKTPAPTLPRLTPVLIGYPCSAIIANIGQSRIATYKQPNGTQNLTQFKKPNDKVTIYDDERNASNQITWYRLNDTRQAIPIWVEAQYVNIGSNCPTK